MNDAQSILDTLPDDRTIQWGDATFEIRKLLPTEAKPLFIRHVRPLLKGAGSAEATPGVRAAANAPQQPSASATAPEAPGFIGETESWRIMLAAFTDAPAEHYEAVSKAMARSIIVTRAGEKRPLAGNEDWAFQGLEGAHMVILDVRSFCVNFIGWWPAIASELPQLARAFASLLQPTSIPSSETS